MPPIPHVPQSAPPVPAAPAESADAPGWETLELARHSADAHATFQRLMTEAHLEYLRVIEALTQRPADAVRPDRRTDPGADRRAGSPADSPGATTPAAVPSQADRHGSVPVAVDRTGSTADRPEADGGSPGAVELDGLTGSDATGTDEAAHLADPASTEPDSDTLTTSEEPTLPGLDGFGLPDSAGEPAEVDVVRLTMSWARTPLGGLAPPGLHAGPVHVVDGGSGLGAAVAAELTARGLAAEVATHPGLGGVIFLGGMARPASPDEAIEAQLTALWLARNGKDRGIFVTVADTVSGRVGAWLGGLVGLVGAVGRERPSTSAIAIECERGDRDPAAVAVLIADELTRGAGAQRVRVAADGTRSVGRLVSAGTGTPRERVLGPESVIVASGEARGFCGAALVELARSTRCRLVLLGRTPLAAEPEHLAGAADEVSLMRKFAAGTGGPDGLAGMRTRARAVLAAREIRRTIDACVAAGAQARYVYADDRDADRLTAELDQVRSDWGPITGVLHCAEVTADRRPGEKSAADADRSLSTHLAGLPALLAATVQDPLDTLMLFSSVAGWSGDLAQGTQALIGATLDRIAEAEQRRRPACLVRSLAWDPADGVVPALTGETGRAEAEAVPVHVRAAAFVAELAVDGPAHIVLTPRSTVADRAQPASVAVDAGTHPWLADHRPQDVAILPLAAGLGWMAAAARVREQDAVLTGVRVLRPVATEHPQTIGVTVFGREVWLSNDTGEPCFRAGFGAPGPDREWRPTGDPARFPGSSVYAGRPLFHGPRLHVVRSLGEIGPDGVVGTVLGARAMGWPEDDLPVDLAALDGALQLSGVWAMDEHRPVLPMGVTECRIHRWGRLPGPALCVVADGHRDDRGARCDAALVGPDGELWAELLGIEFVAPLNPR